jgi:hypothetical protein
VISRSVRTNPICSQRTHGVLKGMAPHNGLAAEGDTMIPNGVLDRAQLLADVSERIRWVQNGLFGADSLAPPVLSHPATPTLSTLFN